MKAKWLYAMAVVVLAFPTSGLRADMMVLQAEDYMVGGEGVGYHDTGGGNNGGQYRADDVDVENASDVGGGYNVGWTDGGEWLRLTSDPGIWTTSPTFAGGDYWLSARIAGGSGAFTFHVEIDGSSLGAISGNNTGGWQKWVTLGLGSQVAISAGQRDVKFVCDTGGFNVNYIQFDSAPPPPPPPPPTPDTFPVQRSVPNFTPPIHAGLFSVREVLTTINMNDNHLSDAVTGLSDPAYWASHVDYTDAVINLIGNGGDGRFSPSEDFHTGRDLSNVLMIAKARFVIPAGQGGEWTFGVNSDDGFELGIDGYAVALYDGGRGASDTIQAVTLTEGEHDLQLIFEQGGGGYECELYAAKGNFSMWDDSMRLVGDTANGGLELVPEPATLVLLGLGAAATFIRRRRR